VNCKKLGLLYAQHLGFAVQLDMLWFGETIFQLNNEALLL